MVFAYCVADLLRVIICDNNNLNVKILNFYELDCLRGLVAVASSLKNK